MKLSGLVLLNALFLSSAGAISPGASVEGHVALPRARPAPVTVKRYEIVTTNGILATEPPLAVVYLEGDFAKPRPAVTKEVAQKDLAFLPPLLAIQVGTRVQFPNLDDTYHNVFSYSPAKRFDLGRYQPNERPIPSELFDRAGLVTLRCDIHEHMRGLILVLDTPHFVITNADGQFHMSGLPEGRYSLKAWIDSKTTREQAVELKRGSTLRVDFP
jgi:plastocyanin